MPKEASGVQSPFGKEEGLRPLENRIELNYNKGIGHTEKRKRLFHAVQQTSLEAYLDQKFSGELGAQQEQVLQGFRDFGDHTALEMEGLIGVKYNAIFGCINELVHQFGLLEEKGKNPVHEAEGYHLGCGAVSPTPESLQGCSGLLLQERPVGTRLDGRHHRPVPWRTRGDRRETTCGIRGTHAVISQDASSRYRI